MMKARLRINQATVIDSYPLDEQKDWTSAVLVFPLDTDDKRLQPWQREIAIQLREALGIYDLRVEIEVKP